MIARERYLLFGRCSFDVCLVAPAASNIAFQIASAPGVLQKSARLHRAEVLQIFCGMLKGPYPSPGWASGSGGFWAKGIAANLAGQHAEINDRPNENAEDN